MSKILNDKNTKNEFMAEYKKQLEEIKELRDQLANPQEQVAAKKAAETLDTAKNVVNGDITSVVTSLQEQVVSALAALTSKVETGSEQLVSLESAIDLKKVELQELFDIEATAYSLTALVNTEKTLKIQYGLDKKEREAELQSTIKELNEQINSLKDTLSIKLREIDSQVRESRSRAIAELDYELSRKKQVDNDNWADEKKEREAILAQKEKETELRIATVETRESKMEELEAKVKEIPTLVEEAKTKAYDEGKKKAGTEYAFEKRAIEANARSEKAILESKVEMLEDTVDRQNEEIRRLNSDLKDAYAKINDTARATVEAQANARMVNSLESIARDNKSQK
jgi:chromosome segregation ATPase